jgi:hypothetical protein
VTSQGAYLGWNALTRATGETDFINNQGGGSGGFAFMNTPSSGTPRTPLMVISGAGNVEVTGTVKAQSVDGNMKVVYQRDDQEQTTYQKPLWRYHMTLTAAQYGGRTKTIPKEILTKLCGTRDGCEVRLGDTRWDNASRTETESVVNRFYYSPNDGHWRVSWPRNTEGIIGTGATQEAMNTSGQCIFTDGTFNNYEDQGDKNTGMQLYVAGRNSALTCELTIIP